MGYQCFFTGHHSSSCVQCVIYCQRFNKSHPRDGAKGPRTSRGNRLWLRPRALDLKSNNHPIAVRTLEGVRMHHTIISRASFRCGSKSHPFPLSIWSPPHLAYFFLNSGCSKGYLQQLSLYMASSPRRAYSTDKPHSLSSPRRLRREHIELITILVFTLDISKPLVQLPILPAIKPSPRRCLHESCPHHNSLRYQISSPHLTSSTSPRVYSQTVTSPA